MDPVLTSVKVVQIQVLFLVESRAMQAGIEDHLPFVLNFSMFFASVALSLINAYMLTRTA
ncbi:hypothetical protein ABT294_22380 [Nonomuraea sp. NPDC000554]|uniref:hypothetical protein n=1 Tax=Nonomuraea sp. NPDC000554 TaxID=3154259 RepID=UPI003326B087